MYASPKLTQKKDKSNDSRSEKSDEQQDLVKENKSSLKLESYQLKADRHSENSSLGVTQLKSNRNNTGLPDNIKNGVESLSGQSLDDVKVHYNSDKPTQMKAHAFAEGNQIHVAGGQEKHLAHEAWHVVQQKEKRVSPTTKINGLNVNTDKSLEKEADVMGAKAASLGNNPQNSTLQLKSSSSSGRGVVQGLFGFGEKKKEGPEEKGEEAQLAEKGKAAAAATELNKMKADSDNIYKDVQLLDNPGKKPESVSSALMGNTEEATKTVKSGVFGAIASLAGPIVKIAGGVATGKSKWAAWTNLKKLGTDQEEKGKADKNIAYTIGKLAKAFLMSVNTVIQGIIDLVQVILTLVPEGLSKAAAAGLATYQLVRTGLGKLYSVPKRWYQLYKGNNNKKDVNSAEVVNKAFANPPDDDSIDFIWALNLPSVKGSGFDSIDELKNSAEKFVNNAKNAAIDGVGGSVAGNKIPKSEDPQNIAGMIKAGGSDGKAAFKKLIVKEKLNANSKNKIRNDVKKSMTGVGT
jgi:hypothetical protein